MPAVLTATLQRHCSLARLAALFAVARHALLGTRIEAHFLTRAHKAAR